MKFADKHAGCVSLEVVGSGGGVAGTTVSRAGGVKAAAAAAMASSVSGFILFVPSALSVCVRVFVCLSAMVPLHVCQASCVTPPDLLHPPGVPQSASSSSCNNTLTDVQGKKWLFLSLTINTDLPPDLFEVQ